ncbi:MAG: hypothetical protein SPI21_12355 [Hungatella hathewayi]|uniref:Uncharacterized protein n=2 Tax=Hungatella hathewayi TaxID=154046 RepID=A0AAW9WGT5_9FIRM|nr:MULTISPECIES: hypothetical protein [Hungatella]MCI7382170.1 hypothetical protein [Hungatella sp.]MCQ4828362.1 hypothetical protein [Hungatella sp. SL.1.14]MDY6237569.1 hypothetical protein [Hungatella hathewayi]MUB63162.1 hypothetical protein [Hungatella hathewayi]
MCSPVTFIFAVRIQMAAHWDIKPIGTAPHPKPRKNLKDPEKVNPCGLMQLPGIIPIS